MKPGCNCKPPRATFSLQLDKRLSCERIRDEPMPSEGVGKGAGVGVSVGVGETTAVFVGQAVCVIRTPAAAVAGIFTSERMQPERARVARSNKRFIPEFVL